MKKLVTITICIVIILVGYFLWSDYDIKNYPPKSKGNIIAFGDSLTRGIGSSDGKDYVTLLSAKLGVPILNKGVSGDTTEGALARLKEDVLDNDPKIVLVMLGGNDFIRRVPRATTFKNLESIVTQIQDKGAVVVLVGVRGGLINDPVDGLYEDLAEKTGSVYIEDILDGVYGHKDLMSDGIHPNDRGYALVAERLHEEFKSLLEK
ncbi:MAG: GDSL-type esterase/lipase family protein [Patescibacteria group bacterium]